MVDVHRLNDPVGDSLRALAGAGGLQVVDVGGGSGTRAVPLAVFGNKVTVVDPSIDALATLRRRAAEVGVQDQVTAVQADTDALGPAVADGGADLMLCHHVLEEVDDPQVAMASMASGLRPGGTLSLLISNKNAAVIALSVAGRFADATAVADSEGGNYGSTDPLRRRFDTGTIRALLEDAGLMIASITGIGVVSGLVPGAVIRADPRGVEQLAALESLLAQQSPLCDIATDLHVLAQRPSEG